MSDQLLSEFVSIFNDRVINTRQGDPDVDGIAPLEPRENTFTEVFLEDMEDKGLIADSDVVFFEKKLGKSNGKLNGFGVTEDGSQLVLITTLEGGGELIIYEVFPPVSYLKQLRRPFRYTTL